MRHLTIGTSVRPGRVAVLVDINEPQWQHVCTRIIEFFTRLWGGCGNIIVPTDGKRIGALFWSILERFDPDYLEVYQRTGWDVEIEEPAKFEEAYQRHIAAWERQIEGKTEQHAAESIRDGLRRGGLTSFAISPELQEELRDRLAPFYFQQWIVEAGAIGACSIPRHPHTDVVDVLPFVEHPARVFKVNDGGAFPALWWASSFGRVSPRLESDLGTKNIETFEFGTSPDDIRMLIRLGVKEQEDIHSAAGRTYESFQSRPERLSMAGLGHYRSVRNQDATESAVAVAGIRVEDFALYYALSRMRKRVVWIPPYLTDDALAGVATKPVVDERFHFVNDLASLSRGTSQRYAGLKIITATLEDAQLAQVIAALSEKALSPFESCESGSALGAIPAYLIRHYEMNNAHLLRSITVPDNGVIPLFETPIPKNFGTVDPSKHRWLTEVRVNNYHLPRHYVLGERLMGAPYFTSKDVRVSAEGPTYFCPSNFIFSGATAETSVPRPSIEIPECLEIFRSIARSCSLSCEISDKGVYAESACQKFGGLAPLSKFLRSLSGQLFVSAFLDKTKREEGEHLKGALLANRRYLDLDSLGAVLGSEGEAARLLDRLSLSAVVYRGFILQCQHCRRADWFPLGELTDAFTCKRCHRQQIFTHRHWRYPNQPHLYYQLDELVYLGLEHNMEVPILALDNLRRSSEDSFLHVPELKYAEKELDDDEKPLCEVDLNCVIDGLLTIGEAKKDDRLGSNDKQESELISKYLNVGKRLAVHQIVFATSCDQWHPKTIEAINSAFTERRFRLILLTRNDLYK
jgi:hypothetical protein